jgi:hypothetical protein
MELKKDIALKRNREYSGCSSVPLFKRHEGDEEACMEEETR